MARRRDNEVKKIVTCIKVDGKWVDEKTLDPKFVEKVHDKIIRRAIRSIGGQIVERG